MKNLKVDFTINTGRQYENVHVSAEVETLEEGVEFGKEAEELYHNLFIEAAAKKEEPKDETLEF